MEVQMQSTNNIVLIENDKHLKNGGDITYNNLEIHENLNTYL